MLREGEARDGDAEQDGSGKFQLVDLPPAQHGIPQIEVTFEIDANGIVHVSAEAIWATGKEQSMTITGQSSLPKDDIERMIRDAEQHAADDRQRREEAEIRNNADSLVYRTEKLIRDEGDKFTGDEKDKVESAVKELKEALEGTDIATIRSRTETLLTASQSFAERFSQRGVLVGCTGMGAPGSDLLAQSDDEVVDAEIVDERGRGGGMIDENRAPEELERPFGDADDSVVPAGRADGRSRSCSGRGRCGSRSPPRMNGVRAAR